MRRFVIVLSLLAAGGVACPQDKTPDAFDMAGPSGDGGRNGTGDDASNDCLHHEDCADDELCFEGECVDRDDALSDCEEDQDCPDGFICVDTMCEEE